MSNSKLVDYTRLTKNCSTRTGKISKITIHHMAGNLSVEQCASVFSGTRQASSNYGIGTDGRVGLYVEEKNRAWTSSSRANDNIAVTIEVANSKAADPWPVSDAAYEKLILLCADICRRNGIEQLNYTGDTSGNLTMHCWFAATNCPGPYLKERFPEIARRVNALLENDVDEGDEDVVRYERLSDIKYKEFHDVIELLMNANILGGDGSDPDGNDDKIDLSHDMVRNLVLEYRGGAFDRKLIAMGMEPAVKD